MFWCTYCVYKGALRVLFYGIPPPPFEDLLFCWVFSLNGGAPLPPLPCMYQFPYIPGDDKSCSLFNVFGSKATRCPFDWGIQWAARSSSFSWCLPLRRSDSGKPLLTRVLVLSATSFYFFFGFSSCQSTEMKINNWQWHSLTALAYWLTDNRMWHF